MSVRVRLRSPFPGGLSPAMLASGGLHLTVLAIWIFGPLLGPRRPSLADAIPVELVGGVPGPVSTTAPDPGASETESPPLRSEAAEEPAAEEAADVVEDVAPEPAPPDPSPPAPVPQEDTAWHEETELKRLDTPEPAARSRAPAEEPYDAAAAERARSGTAGGGGGSGYSIASEGLEASELAWYRDRVVASLRARWRQPLLEGYSDTLTVRVRFVIQRDGRVTGVTIDAGSGVPSLDRSAERAVVEASPLPPLPRQVRSSTLPATFVFRWDP